MKPQPLEIRCTEAFIGKTGLGPVVGDLESRRAKEKSAANELRAKFLEWNAP
jgi:hypothetical protein